MRFIVVTLIALVAVIPLSTRSCAAGVISHYDIDATINPPKGELSAQVTLTCVAPEGGLEKVEMLLNKGLKVTSVTSDAGLKSSHFDPADPSPNRYMPTASPLVVELSPPVKPGASFHISVSYQGKIQPDPYLTNILTPEWVELALYAAWYPVSLDLGMTTSNVKVSVDEPYFVTGTGTASREGKRWVFNQDQPTFDIVVVAAPQLKMRQVGNEGFSVEVWHKNLKEEQVDQIAGGLASIVKELQGWLGTAPNRKLRLVFAERTSGGGYYRPGFMSLIYDNDYRGLFKYAGHEAAHFWWNRGNVNTWEDWLNESFAEYSSLMLVRGSFGPSAYSEFIEKYTREAEKAPPIWGLDRNDKAAQVVLYEKGAVLLGKLEGRIGNEDFVHFLATLIDRRVGSTDLLLSTLEELTSKDVRAEFEHGLRN